MLLNYVEQANPTGIKDVLDKIRAFAVSQGWVQEEWQQDKLWNTSSPYGWLNDSNGDYLCLSSLGYGSQSLIAKLELRVAGPDMGPTICCNMCSSKEYTLSSAYPFRQNTKVDLNQVPNSSGFYGWSLPASQMERIWIFGDEKWICALVNINGSIFNLMHFGSFEMFDDNPTEGDVTGRIGMWGYPHKEWDDFVAGSALFSGFFSQIGLNRESVSGYFQRPFGIWFGGRDLTLYPNNAIGGTLYEEQKLSVFAFIHQYQNALVRNNFSGRRVLLKQVYFHKRAEDSVWEPICQTPCYFCNFQGLSPGELLVYGDEEYLVFPVGPYTTDRGIAFRVA
ncbi:hypothetical protein [Desulfatiglans anilini]|uniref:hypothetical protein n=1 Tax=Desulfatiglans anilini TaxID=90728 RepID=UPI00041403CA|nr:hypothetical protein [Desulfatiglans anilini]